MPTVPNKILSPPARGITLVEILMVVSVLVIIASFALPSVGAATARADLRSATEHVSHAVSAARNLARASESPIAMSFRPDPDGRTHRVSLTDASNRPVIGWQNYPVPESIRLDADREVFVFNARGLVDHPGEVRLVARANENIHAELAVH